MSERKCYDESPCELDRPCDYCYVYLCECEGYSMDEAKEIIEAYENRQKLGIDVKFKTNVVEKIEHETISEDKPDPNDVP